MLPIQEIITKLENISDKILPTLKIEAEQHFTAIDKKNRVISNHPGNLDVIKQAKSFNMFCLQEEKLRSDVANYGILYYEYIKEIYAARFLIKKCLEVHNDFTECVVALDGYLNELQQSDNDKSEKEDKIDISSAEIESLNNVVFCNHIDCINVESDKSVDDDIEQIYNIIDETEYHIAKLYKALKLIDDAMTVFAIKYVNNPLFARAVYYYATCFDKGIISWCDVWINHVLNNTNSVAEDGLERLEFAVKSISPPSTQVAFKVS